MSDRPVRPKHRLEFAVFWFFFQLTRLLPRRALLAAGRGLGGFAGRVVKFRREVVLENLRAAFGAERDEAWLEATADAFYRHLGMLLLEFLAAGHRRREDLVANVDMEGCAILDRLRAAGRGAVILSGHLGNFELMAPRAAAQGYPVHGVVKRQSNALIDRFHNRIRAREGVGIIYTGGSFDEVVARMRDGEFVGILGDQDARERGQFVEFLGRPASVSRGAATLAVKAGCPIVMVFITRRDDGTHVLRIGPLLEPAAGLEGEAAVTELTARHTGLLAEAIRRDPDQYYWIHRRWKTQPPPS